MVMRFEVQRGNDSSFLSMASEEDVQVILIENNASYCDSSNGRDTSTCCRDSSMDNTRQTVNTHNSILDLTKEEEEEEDEDDEEELQSSSVLFDDLQHVTTEASTIRTTVVTPDSHKHTNILGKLPSFGTVTDSFVDSLCPAEVVTHTSCTPYCTITSAASTEQRLQIGVDVWTLLGCNNKPGEDELEGIWALKTARVLNQTPKPARSSIKDRMRKIHRLRMERTAETKATRHGISLTSKQQNLMRAYTMDDRMEGDDLEKFIGLGLDPILPRDDTGYDSDPEFGSSMETREHYQSSSLMDNDDADEELSDPNEEDKRVQQSVQETLNSTWTVTWHPNEDNMKEFAVPPKPICINIWIERGTVIQQSGQVLEPQLMWRDAYQPELAKRKLNASTRKPWFIRLLNTCRIAHATKIDRTRYPLARKNTSFFLRTCQGQEFLLEASSPDECEHLCSRWKMVVARFASLAVTEDIDAIAEEFFHPTPNSQMLTTHDMEEDY